MCPFHGDQRDRNQCRGFTWWPISAPDVAERLVVFHIGFFFGNGPLRRPSLGSYGRRWYIHFMVHYWHPSYGDLCESWRTVGSLVLVRGLTKPQIGRASRRKKK